MAPTDDTIKDFEEYGNKWLWPVMLKRFSDIWPEWLKKVTETTVVGITEGFKPRIARVRSMSVSW